MPSYILVYYDSDWYHEGLNWYQTLFQRVTADETLIVSLIRATSTSPPTTERAGLFTSIYDSHGQHWKLIRWVQADEIMLVKG